MFFPWLIINSYGILGGENWICVVKHFKSSHTPLIVYLTENSFILFIYERFV